MHKIKNINNLIQSIKHNFTINKMFQIIFYTNNLKHYGKYFLKN
jgi:hypothetical protein